jgi:hypothetical protein
VDEIIQLVVEHGHAKILQGYYDGRYEEDMATAYAESASRTLQKIKISLARLINKPKVIWRVYARSDKYPDCVGYSVRFFYEEIDALQYYQTLNNKDEHTYIESLPIT